MTTETTEITIIFEAATETRTVRVAVAMPDDGRPIAEIAEIAEEIAHDRAVEILGTDEIDLISAD